MARKDERSTRLRQASGAATAQHSEISEKTLHLIFQCSKQVCLTSTAALRESIHQRSRSNRDSGTDDCWQTVLTVGE